MTENAKILVVDDDPDIRTVLSALLESRGYQVVTASDGKEGLDALKAEKPNLMILDLLMSEMDGFTVMQKLKDPRLAKYAHIPIMVLTSVREDASRRRYELETGVSMDVDDYIEKPINPPVVLERVERLLTKSKA
ncbi:MAG: response regulator [Chloroflexi bacterium]|jgi:two-component system, OmpR family, response regulator|nr:response regulator [Chloroflexota bacterium]